MIISAAVHIVIGKIDGREIMNILLFQGSCKKVHFITYTAKYKMQDVNIRELNGGGYKF